MTPGETNAARLRRLRAELRADRRALEDRTGEVAAYSTGEHSAERTAALALALDRAYTALEAILERIARTLEGDIPSGDDWHRVLLHNAGLEIEKVRPSILSGTVISAADELRRFRHFLRHAYAAPLDAARVEAVAAQWLDVRSALSGDLDELERFLGDLADELESPPG